MFFVLKFRELKVSLAEFCKLYNVERTAVHRCLLNMIMKFWKGLRKFNLSSNTVLRIWLK